MTIVRYGTSVQEAQQPSDTGRMRLRHLYRTPGREPQVGDKALCGWIKVRPQGAPDLWQLPSCVVCDSLEEGLR